MKIRTVKDLLEEKKRGENICIKGWVRTRRGSKNVSFIALNDSALSLNLFNNSFKYETFLSLIFAVKLIPA